MRFEQKMNLAELAAVMGPEASQEDAASMRELLLKTGYQSIGVVPENDWIECMEKVAELRYGASSAKKPAIRGADYLAFLHDAEFWPDIDQGETYAECVQIEIDGKLYEQPDIEPTTITEGSTVVIVAGDVFQFMTRLHSLQDHYDAWSEARNKGPK